jgi:hypothetical protein
VRQLFLPRILVAAAAVLVIGRDRRVVVAGDPLDPRPSQPLDDLVRPRCVADEVTEMIGRIDVSPTTYGGKHRFERGKVRVDVGDECVFHPAALLATGPFSSRPQSTGTPT